jgi:CubicO group peptidase (beta-lactamase class C family)
VVEVSAHAEVLIEKFKNNPLDFEPGTRGYVESNSNYNLLAFIIEKLSNKSYGEFLEENIFAPLGMKDSGHDARPEAMLKNRASGYVPAGISDLKNAPYLIGQSRRGTVQSIDNRRFIQMGQIALHGKDFEASDNRKNVRGRLRLV